jgi:glycosyltransferase involved in cell wall biosynthesis
MLRHARRYTAIHLHAHVDRYFIAYLLAKLAGCKLLFSCTLDDSPRQLLETYRPLFRPLVRRLYRLIDQFVVISPKLRDDSLDIVAPGQIHLVPQGAAVPSVSSPSECQRHRARLGLREGDVALLYVGSLSARKNVLFLIESMPAIKAADGRVKLFVVGPDLEPDYGAAVRRLAAETGLSDSVHFTNRTEDPDPYYRAADMVVFGSLSEGFGNVLLEGMAYGLPVVARRLPGVTDFFIADGSNGFLFDTAEAYRMAVLRLAAEPELRRRIGDNARRSVERDFTLDAIARRYVSLYGA